MTRSKLGQAAEMLRRPLPALAADRQTRWLCRSVSLGSLPFLRSVQGVEYVDPRLDPFIVALNHSQRFEAVFVPTRLIHERGGHLLHFVADWQFLMVPGVARLYRRSRVIVSSRKSARPKILDALKVHLCPAETVLQQATQRLEEGASIGFFPEGRMNRDPANLLPGHLGTAHLAIRSGVPVIPAGLRFPRVVDRPIRDWDAMRLHIGAPLAPPRANDRETVRHFHRQIMRRIGQLSGKALSAPRDRTDLAGRSAEPVLQRATP